MKIDTIFLDLDGVLCDMVGPSLQIHGREELLTTWPKGMYDLEATLGITMDEFWEKIDAQGYDFWANLPPYEWMQDFIDVCRIHANVVLCSKPSRSHFSSGGKHQWINKHFGKRFRDFIITPQKHHMAKPGCVLIDDSEKNILEFQASGGCGLLFPQPWNNGIGDVASVVNDLNMLAAM